MTTIYLVTYSGYGYRGVVTALSNKSEARLRADFLNRQEDGYCYSVRESELDAPFEHPSFGLKRFLVETDQAGGHPSVRHWCHQKIPMHRLTDKCGWVQGTVDAVDKEEALKVFRETIAALEDQ